MKLAEEERDTLIVLMARILSRVLRDHRYTDRMQIPDVDLLRKLDAAVLALDKRRDA